MSISGITSTALSGMRAQTTRIGAIANNVANVSTPGYARLNTSLTTTEPGGVQAAVEPTATAGRARPGGIAIHDLAAALRSGQLDGRSAVDKVIDRIVTAQVGPDAPAHVRDKVQAALRDALDDDPLLADKLRSL